MKPIHFFLCIISVYILVCAAQAGETLENKVEFKYGDVYYESPITKELAIKVGEFLENMGEGERGGVFGMLQMYRFDGKSRVQLVNVRDTYQVKFALMPGMETDKRTFQMFRIVWALLGGCCGAPLEKMKKEVHLCDSSFNTLRVIGRDK